MDVFVLWKVCCFTLMLVDVVLAIESIRYLEPIHFVVGNHNGSGQFEVVLPSDASVTELYRAMAESRNVTFPFELHLFGETIASARWLNEQPLLEIPGIASIVKDMNEIWGSGFRIFLRMHRIIPSDSDFSVYASLAQMFGGPDFNIYKQDWYQFVLYCLESRSCLIQDLCDRSRFGHIFYCDERGELTGINLRGKRIEGHLDLSATPRTIWKILMERTSLAEIIGLDRLAGKSLTCLDVRENHRLRVDLRAFMVDDNPLKILRVNPCQISRSLVGMEWTHNPRTRVAEIFYDEVYQAAIRWMESSSLDLLVIGFNRPHIQRQREATNGSRVLLVKGWPRYESFVPSSG